MKTGRVVLLRRQQDTFNKEESKSQSISPRQQEKSPSPPNEEIETIFAPRNQETPHQDDSNQSTYEQRKLMYDEVRRRIFESEENTDPNSTMFISNMMPAMNTNNFQKNPVENYYSVPTQFVSVQSNYLPNNTDHYVPNYNYCFIEQPYQQNNLSNQFPMYNSIPQNRYVYPSSFQQQLPEFNPMQQNIYPQQSDNQFWIPQSSTSNNNIVSCIYPSQQQQMLYYTLPSYPKVNSQNYSPPPLPLSRKPLIQQTPVPNEPMNQPFTGENQYNTSNNASFTSSHQQFDIEQTAEKLRQPKNSYDLDFPPL